MGGIALAESGSWTSRGRSPLRAMGFRCKGGGRPFSKRFDRWEDSPISDDDEELRL